MIMIIEFDMIYFGFNAVTSISFYILMIALGSVLAAARARLTLAKESLLWLILSYLDIHLTDATTELKTWYGGFLSAY